MRRLYFALLVLTVSAVSSIIFAEHRRPPEVAVQDGGDTQTALPVPLRPSLPEAIPEPHNSCSRLTIPDTTQRNTTLLTTQINGANARTERLRNTIALPHEILRGDAQRKSVALSIDMGTGGADGVEQLLAIAAHYDIPLTFFLTGCWIVENPELTQEIFRQGHGIANHTLTHRNLAQANDAEIEREISETDRIIREVTGVTPFLFRKPLYAGGSRVTEIVGGLGKISVQGYPDFGDTTGWRSGVTSADVSTLIRQKTVPGAIWVFHNLSVADLGAFEDSIRFHLQEGYAVVRIEELIVP